MVQFHASSKPHNVLLLFFFLVPGDRYGLLATCVARFWPLGPVWSPIRELLATAVTYSRSRWVIDFSHCASTILLLCQQPSKRKRHYLGDKKKRKNRETSLQLHRTWNKINILYTLSYYFWIYLRSIVRHINSNIENDKFSSSPVKIPY